MAWLEKENGIYLICFRYQDERIKRSARTRDERKALSMAGRIEENIELVERGRLCVPDDADLFAFLLSDGQLNGKVGKRKKRIKLSDLFPTYRNSLPENSLAQETQRIAEIHMNHIVRLLGGRRQIQTIARADLQEYINVRSKETGKRGKPVSPSTITKELSTFRTLWRWARRSEFVEADFPNDALHFPRSQQKLPFSTWEQIEQRIRRGIPNGHTEADYWDCLYLYKNELDDLLSDVEQHSTYNMTGSTGSCIGVK